MDVCNIKACFDSMSSTFEVKSMIFTKLNYTIMYYCLIYFTILITIDVNKSVLFSNSDVIILLWIDKN